MNIRRLSICVSTVALAVGFAVQGYSLTITNNITDKPTTVGGYNFKLICNGNTSSVKVAPGKTVEVTSSSDPKACGKNGPGNNPSINVAANFSLWGQGYSVGAYPAKKITLAEYNNPDTTIDIPNNPKLYDGEVGTPTCLTGETKCINTIQFTAKTPSVALISTPSSLVPIVKKLSENTGAGSHPQYNPLFTLTNYFSDMNNTPINPANPTQPFAMGFQCSINGMRAEQGQTCAQYIESKLGLTTNTANKNERYSFWGTLNRNACPDVPNHAGWKKCSIKFSVIDTCAVNPNPANGVYKNCSIKYPQGTVVTTSTPGTAANPATNTLDIYSYSGFVKKSLQQTYATGVQNNQNQITIPIVLNGGSASYSLTQPDGAPRYFTETPDITTPVSGSDVTYCIVGQGSCNTDGTVPDRQGTWKPINVSQEYTSGSSTMTTKLSISGQTLNISNSNPTFEGIIQFTLKATYNGQSAYRTLYVNISPKNAPSITPSTGGVITGIKSGAIYTPLTAFNGIYIYNSNSNTGPDNPNGPDGALQASQGFSLPTPWNKQSSNDVTANDDSTCTPTSDYYPNCVFVPQINKQKIEAVYPDIGWLAFANSAKNWPASTTPLSNNITTRGSNPGVRPIQDIMTYYKENVTVPNFKFITTYEFDTPVRALIPTIQMFGAPDAAEGTYPQLSVLAQTLVKPLVTPVTIDSKTYNYDGLQLDVEPFSSSGNSPEAYKRIADLLAQHGKPFEIYAFANTATPALIMGMGPLGIFVPSTYDVGMQTDTTYNDTYSKNFTFPDYSCHSPKGSTPAAGYAINSYCNTNVNNMLFNNSLRFYQPKLPSFLTIIKDQGGHYQMAIPTEGSATAWEHEKVYTPTPELDIYSTERSAVPSIPFAWQQPAKQLTTNSTWPEGTTIPDGCSANVTEQCFIESGLTGYIFTGSDAGYGSYWLVNSNPNNDNPALGSYEHASTQSLFVQSLINYFQGSATDPKYTPYLPKGSPLPVSQNFGKPGKDNPWNLGLAMYGLSVPETYGCQSGGNHHGQGNCIVPFPVSTPDCLAKQPAGVTTNGTPDSSCINGQVPNPIWKMVQDYTYGSVPPSGPLKVLSASGSSANGNITITWTYSGAIPASTNPFEIQYHNTSGWSLNETQGINCASGSCTETISLGLLPKAPGSISATVYASPQGGTPSKAFTDVIPLAPTKAVVFTNLNTTPSSDGSVKLDWSFSGGVPGYGYFDLLLQNQAGHVVQQSRPNIQNSCQGKQTCTATFSGLTPGATYNAVVYATDSSGAGTTPKSEGIFSNFTVPSSN